MTVQRIGNSIDARLERRVGLVFGVPGDPGAHWLGLRSRHLTVIVDCRLRLFLGLPDLQHRVSELGLERHALFGRLVEVIGLDQLGLDRRQLLLLRTEIGLPLLSDFGGLLGFRVAILDDGLGFRLRFIVVLDLGIRFFGLSLFD